MKTLLLYILLAGYTLAKPLPPYTSTLNKTEIQSIPIHTEIDTLLVFPEPITTILGKGLTTAVSPHGSVLYQQGSENPKTLILRHVDAKSKVLMTVMSGDNAYVFRLEPSINPASVIYFVKGNLAQPAKEITKQEVLLQQRPLSDQRVDELFRLSHQAHSLRSKIPQEYVGYSDKHVHFQHTHGSIKTTIHHVSKFTKDKALIFSGIIHNTGSKPLYIQQYLGKLRVGKKRFYDPSSLRSNKQAIAPNSIARFQGILLGGSHIQALSLDNTFTLHLTK